MFTYTASGAYWKLLKCFLGVGAFDHLEWTYNGAFEQLFGLGRGEFEQKFSKNSNAREGGGVPWGGCLTFDLTGTLRILKQASPKWFYEKCAKIKAL